MIRVVVTGVAGRMGSTVVRAVRDQQDMRFVGGPELKGSTAIGMDVGLAAQLPALQISGVADLGPAIDHGGWQVLIDFTGAEASAEHARIGADRGVPLVIGSTRLSSDARAEMARCSQKIAVMMSPNMSV